MNLQLGGSRCPASKIKATEFKLGKKTVVLYTLCLLLRRQVYCVDSGCRHREIKQERVRRCYWLWGRISKKVFRRDKANIRPIS